jgi:hypothetical protein
LHDFCGRRGESERCGDAFHAPRIWSDDNLDKMDNIV